jgi:hypothetical protein
MVETSVRMMDAPCPVCQGRMTPQPCPGCEADEPIAPEPCHICTDLDWLLMTGETSPETLAQRLGFTRYDSVLKHLQRHERHDILTRAPARRASRTAA